MKDKSSIFTGTLFLIAAVLIVLNSLGYSLGVGVVGIMISIVIVACLVKSIVKLSFGGILFSLAFLAIIYAQPLQIPAKLVPWPILFVALFGTIGLNLIFKKNSKFHNLKAKQNAYGRHRGMFSESTGAANGDYVAEKNSFSGTTKYIKSQNFVHAELHNHFGEFKVYFDEANITGNTATIQVSNSFGEMSLYIPKSWHVEHQIVRSFGSVEEYAFCQNVGTPTVIIEGSVNFGEIKIIYV